MIHDLKPVWDAPHYDETLLPVWINPDDWEDSRTILPELGPSSYFKEDQDGFYVVPINGLHYKIRLLYNYQDHQRDDDWEWTTKGKRIEIEQTDKPLSKAVGWDDIRFFGQPQWRQASYFPTNLHGRPCSHLLTLENGWGDSGNWNILVGLDPNEVPEIFYFEASCC